MNNDFQEQEAIRYFLGELSESGQSAVEERFFTDAEFSDWLDEVETDLIDSYVRGELDAAQNQKFEQNFLVSERRRSRVEAAAALWEKERASAPSVAAIAETAKPSFWEGLKGLFTVPQLAYASLGVLFLALVGGIALFWRSPAEIVRTGNENLKIEPTKQSSPPVSPASSPARTPDEIPPGSNSQTVEPQKTPSPEKQTDEPKKQTPRDVRESSPVLAQISLTSSSLRSGGNGSNKIDLKAGTERVHLRLKFKTEEEFVKFRIELRDANGNLIAGREVANKKSLGLTVSAKKLRRGDYKITLKGEKADQDPELLDNFELTVEK